MIVRVSEVLRRTVVGDCFDPSFVSQIPSVESVYSQSKLSRSVRSPFVGFVCVVNKSFVRRR